jgi:ferredoxin like protein
VKLPPLPERLAGNRFITDEDERHIVVHQELARSTGTAARLVAVCPAGVYSLAPDGSLAVEEAACLECGTCLAVADPGALSWRYPRGGFGVQYRDG